MTDRPPAENKVDRRRQTIVRAMHKVLDDPQWAETVREDVLVFLLFRYGADMSVLDETSTALVERFCARTGVALEQVQEKGQGALEPYFNQHPPPADLLLGLVEQGKTLVETWRSEDVDSAAPKLGAERTVRPVQTSRGAGSVFSLLVNEKASQAEAPDSILDVSLPGAKKPGPR